MKSLLDELKNDLANKEISDQLKYLMHRFQHQVVFSTSFGLEDQVVTHFIAKSECPIKIFTLDTGRLFPETYATWQHTIEKYNFYISVFYPNATLLEEFISNNGPNSFYESVENRKECCRIRKVEPLQRALNGNKIWITGIRAGQSSNRQDIPFIEWDSVRQIIKFHPLINWTWEDLIEFVKSNGVPYNPLHDKEFVSIGCAPCTRALKHGEDFRAGRWWWEESSKKECGLHNNVQISSDKKGMLNQKD
jgi:phosphoadenosine phosphosulfate reductase